MGHVYTIWQIIGLKNKLSLANVCILKAIVMTDEMTELKFTVKKTDSKRYEIYYEDEMVASAEISEHETKHTERDCTNEPLTTDKHQFYGQLSRFGYEYKNTFRMIDTVFEDGAYIRNVNHWISLLDGMLQTSVQSVDALYLPTKLKRVEINDPFLPLEDIRVFVNQREITTNGNSIIIDGLETTLAPSLGSTNESVKRSSLWISYQARLNDVVSGLDICSQIINENISEYTVLDTSDDSRLFPFVANNASQYNKVTEQTVDVIYGLNIYDKLETYGDKLNNNGFLLNETTADADTIYGEYKFNDCKMHLVASYTKTDRAFYLYRKVSEIDYELINEVKPEINLNGNYIITSQSDSFVKSICKEPGFDENRVICAYNTDSNATSEIAINHAKRHHMRINAEQNGTVGSYRMFDDTRTENNGTDFEIRIDKPGSLQSISLYEIAKGNIDVHYTGLNFKDVMLSYGKLKMKHVQLGLEFSGIRNNNQVMGMGLGLFKSSIDSESVISWEIPSEWNLADAATIPCVYGTVYYALDYKCNIKRNQSILIHAGAGGIGQAAIHLCLLRGLKVYTTCSQNKRQFLKDKFGLTDNQIGNSRDNSFYNWIMAENQGVDIVLNSLAEEKLILSMECLKPFGQFCEIGKYDILQNSQVGLKIFENNISLHVIDLSSMFAHPTLKNVLKSLVQNGLNKNEIMPLNIDRIYDYTKLDEAIRYMGGGNHIGKIVIQMPNECGISPKNINHQFNTTGTHLITGGMGGFGMELGEWLITQGATKVLLMGRSNITSLYQQHKIAKYKDRLVYVQGDITNETDVASVFAEHQIKGVWHLAMKLNDQLYKNLTETTWNQTVSVKEYGTHLLDKYSPDDAMFVCWSSISSLFGNAGQTNYAHGNNMMEIICRDRRADGKHGLAICWGAIDNIGYLSQENSKINKLMFMPQNIDDCLNDLHIILSSKEAVVSCYKIKQTGSETRKANKTMLETVLDIIGVSDITNMDKNTTLTDLGMDSLQSASIKSVLKRFGKDVKPSEMLLLKISDL